MDSGAKQEMDLELYVRSQGYGDTIRNDREVLSFLGLPVGCKCADVLGFDPDRTNVRRVMVAESKGTKVDRALFQLGNAAAGILQRHKGKVDLKLLVYVPRLVESRAGPSPGDGFAAGRKVWLNRYVLRSATEVTLDARATCDLGSPFGEWNRVLSQMRVEVLVAKG